MRVTHVIHCTVNVVCGVILVLFMGKFSRDLECLLTSVRDYHRAIALKDWREIVEEYLKFHFIFEWFGADEGIHAKCEYRAKPSVNGGLWTWNFFRACAKWVCKAQ